MVCVLLSCTREKLEDREFKNTPLGEHWRKWYYTAESEVFVNNPTGRNKLVFSSEEACLLHIRTNKYWLLHSKSAYTIQSEILTPRLLMQLIGTDCGRDIIHPNIWLNATMEKYVPGKSNWVLTDTRFPNEGSGIYQRKVLSLGYKDLKQISKTELICMSLRRLWIYSSLRVLLTIQKICLIC
jgi:hypothetical protein